MSESSSETKSNTSRLLELLKKAEGTVTQVAHQLLSEQRDKILDWISPIRQWNRREELKSLQGTGEWLFADKNYQEWHQRDDSGLVWLHGKSRLFD
jgi:hypothetical protein